MTDRKARRRLHHQLIEIDDKPCLWCGSKTDRIIDRIIEGYRGGRYLMANIRVLCEECHLKRHNKRKFAVGDKVVINGRCPKWLISQLRHNRVRTITSVYYKSNRACCYYYLGNNGIGDASPSIEAYRFRSYMLQHPIARSAGRPSQKRAYTKLNGKCTATAPSQSLTAQRGGVSHYHLPKVLVA